MFFSNFIQNPLSKQCSNEVMWISKKARSYSTWLYTLYAGAYPGGAIGAIVSPKTGMVKLFTITGRINGGLSLAGCRNDWLNPKIQPLSNYEVYRMLLT